MAGTIYDALVTINVQDNDAPAQMARVVAQLEREIASLGSIPEVDLGGKIMGSLGQGVTTASVGVAKMTQYVNELRDAAARLQTIDPTLRTEGVDKAIRDLERFQREAREVGATFEQMQRILGRDVRIPFTDQQRHQRIIPADARRAILLAESTPPQPIPRGAEQEAAAVRLLRENRHADDEAQRLQESERKRQERADTLHDNALRDAASLRDKAGRQLEANGDFDHIPDSVRRRFAGRTTGSDSFRDEQVLAAGQDEGISKASLERELAVERAKAGHEKVLAKDFPETKTGRAERDEAVLASTERLVKAQRVAAEGYEKEAVAAAKLTAAQEKDAAQRALSTATNAEVAKAVDTSASPRIQSMQYDLGTAKAKLQQYQASTAGAAADAEATKLRIQIAKIERQILDAKQREQQQAAQAARPTGFLPSLFGTGGRGGGFGGGGGFGIPGGGGGGGMFDSLIDEAGFAAKYYILYRGFSLIEQTVVGVKTATEEYTIAVNNLSIAMGSNYSEASRAADQYARIGSEMATAPTLAITGATKFTRSFREEDGSVDPGAGRFGATVASLVNVLEGPTRLTNTMESLIAVTRAYGLGPDASGATYDKATRIGQVYGIPTGGDLLPGVAQIADIGKTSGFDMDQLLALVAASMQSTGLTSDAVAGDIKRFLGSDTGDLDKTLGALGGDASGDLASKLEQLASILQKMPESRRDDVLRGLGGSRSGATVIPFIEALSKLEQTQGAAGNIKSATEQANDKLKTLGGAFQQLAADAQEFYTALSQSGAGAAFGAVVLGLHDLLGGLTEVVRFTNQVNPAVRGLAAAIATLGAASAAAARIRGVDNSMLIGGLLPDGAAGAGFRKSQASPLQQFGTGGAALTGVTGGIAALTARTAGLGAAAGAAATAAAPLVAILTTLAAIGSVTAADDKSKAGVADALASRDAADQAIREGNAEAIRAQVLTQRDTAAKIASAGQGFGGRVTDGLRDVVGFYSGQGEQATTDARAQLIANMLRYARELEAEANKAEQLNEARDAAARNFNFSPTFGADYANISGGIKQVIGLGTTPGVQLDVLGDLVNKGVNGGGASVDPLQLQKMFSSTDGEKNVSDLYTDLVAKTAKLTDPSERLDLLKGAQASLSRLNDASSNAGDPATADAATQLLAQSTANYNEAIRSFAEQRINSLKAINGDTPKTRDAITKIATEALTQIGATGDVDQVSTILKGVSKAFIDRFLRNANSQLSLLRSQIEDLNKAQVIADQLAAQMAADVAGAGSANAAERALELGAPSKEAAAEARAKADAKSKQIADKLKVIATVEKATPISAPDNTFFKFDKPDKPKGPTPEDIELARLQSQGIPGDPLSAAQVARRVAQYQLRTADDKVAFYQAQKALREADYQLAQVIQEQANNQVLLNIDITDPLAQARAKVAAARRKLAADQNRGALGDVITADKVALRQSQSDAEKVAFDQRFSDERINYDLQRTSLTAYLSYLRSQHDYLTSVKNKTRQQVDELNQVDQALKSLADGLQGQFNLGDIRIPAPYEVRRAMAGGGNYAATQSTSYVTITINGNDTAAMRQVLADHMGQGVMMAVASAPRKV